MVNSRKYGWEIKGQPLYVEPHDGHQNIGDDPISEKEIKERMNCSDPLLGSYI